MATSYFDLQIDIWRVLHVGQKALTIFETPDITSWLFLPEVRISFFYGIDFVVCTGTRLLSCCAACVCVCLLEFVTLEYMTMM